MEAEENNLDHKVRTERFRRWDTCSLCEQDYHGAVGCALGWACWKTYVSRPETEAQDAFRTARAKLAQELAKTLADASARPSQDASRGA